MANKNNDAILMALLQDLNSYLSGNPYGNAASNGAILMANIKKDGADMGDIHESTAAQIVDKMGSPIDKINFIFEQHPEIAEELDKFADENGLMQEESNNPVGELAQLIQLYLTKKRKYAEGGQFEIDNDFVNVKINGKTYSLLHLITGEQKETGLKNVIELDPQEGALFDYSDSPEPELSFWMQDTEIPLLICFVNEGGKVISVHKGEPLSEEMITESSEFIAYVIEVGINENIKPGDQTSLGKQVEIETEDEEDDIDEYPDLQVNKLYIYGSDGDVQAILQGQERIFSRRSSSIIIRKAKKAYMTKEDKDYKALGRYVFDEMRRQDNRPAEYVDN